MACCRICYAFSLPEGVFMSDTAVVVPPLIDVPENDDALPIDSIDMSDVAESAERMAVVPDSLPKDSVPLDINADTRLQIAIGKLKLKAFNLLEKIAGVPDSVPITKFNSNDWRIRLRQHTLSIWDPDIKWPRFIGFCLKVYRFANYHDPQYVKGDGRYGKVLLVTDSWSDHYLLHPQDGPNIHIGSPYFLSLGIKAKYGILSIGYSKDLNSYLNWDSGDHSRWSLGLSTARFDIQADIWRNRGKSFIYKFGEYQKPDGSKLSLLFDGLSFSAWCLHGIYIFNSKKFSLRAAYNYDNNQLVSMGSALVGIDFSRYRARFDFLKLPDELNEYHKFPYDKYYFAYRTYTILGGYSYNWVFNKHFIFNITATPGIGLTRSREYSTYGSDYLVAFNFRARMAILYTNKRFFVGLDGLVTGNSFITHKLDFFNMIQNYQFGMGLKF